MFIVQEKKPLSECRKDVTLTGEPLTSDNEVSEWAAQYALQKYEIGDEISLDQLQQDLADAVTYQALQSLVEEGIVEESFDGTDFTYQLKK
jgi:hypothetical protein